MLDLLSAFGLLFGVAIALSMAHRLWLQLRSRSWQVTAGTITRSEVDWASPGGEASTKALITFSYAVDGISYSSSQVAVGQGAPVERDAERQVRARPVGASVRVYYDPRDPSRSALDRGEARHTATALAVSLLVAALSAARLWW